jgi:hypothetical protein
MKRSVIIGQGALYCALGTLEVTVVSLLNGTAAVRPGPCFDYPVAFAPFGDLRLCSPEQVFPLLQRRMSVLPERPVFIYAAAKGDMRALEPAPHSEIHPPPSPYLADQAERIADLLALTPCRTHVVSSACASGSAAVGCAKVMLESGLCSEAVIAGFDVTDRHFLFSTQA